MFVFQIISNLDRPVEEDAARASIPGNLAIFFAWIRARGPVQSLSVIART